MRTSALPLVLIALVADSAFAAIPIMTVDAFFLPVTDEEMKMKAPVVDKTAGLEALFTRVHVADGYQSAFYRISVHYVRLKVFTQEGKDKAAALEIPYDDRTTVSDVSGRTIQPDGTILPLSKDGIHDRSTVRVGRLKRRAKSLAMPGVEVGSIIEYRWREIHEGPDIKYMRLQFQDEFPVQKATIFVKPLSRDYVPGNMAIRQFNCTPAPIKIENDGFSSVTQQNIPAFKQEPMMPGEPNVRPWALVFYDLGEPRNNPDKYWNDVAKNTYSEFKGVLKMSGEMKQAAAEAIGAAKDDNEKVIGLIRWTHGHVRDVFSRQVSDGERSDFFKKLPKVRERTTIEILKSGLATADECNTLVAGLAIAAGLDARPVRIANRDDVLFDKSIVEELFLRHVDAAVSINGQWKIYDASTRWLPPGMLSWQEENVAALVADSKSPQFTHSDASAPADSQTVKKAKLVLSEDGTIEGDVSLTWSGHAAEGRRQDMDGESAERRQEGAKDEIRKVYPQAEVTTLHLENADNADQPLELSYHIKIPGYAGRTGKRMFLQPVFFARTEAPTFTAAERKYDVIFPYPWQDTENVTIQLPAGFQLESPENPGDLSFGTPGSYRLAMKAGKGVLTCTRQLTFGNGGIIMFDGSAYLKVKSVFDQIHRRDQVTLSLKQAADQGGGAQ